MTHKAPQSGPAHTAQIERQALARMVRCALREGVFPTRRFDSPRQTRDRS
jgi:hypothetical protein